MNRATLIGHVGKDPEIRSMQSGEKVGNFSLATSQRWTDKNTGEKKEQTEWHRIVVFNDNLCGIIEKYIKKGSKLLVEGEIRTRKWTTESGEDKYSTEIVLGKFGGQIQMLDKIESHSSGADRSLENTTPESYGQTRTRDSTQDYQAPPGYQPKGPPASSGGGGKIDDSIPF
ncbi:MAG: single-stranded DNA-binding protein [Hyphomicrobiaceae bacterium]|nr:single-stranded DNA-binding protein [Hyphomicrobiaceae bacterium]